MRADMCRYEEIRGDWRTCADVQGRYLDRSSRVTENRRAAGSSEEQLEAARSCERKREVQRSRAGRAILVPWEGRQLTSGKEM